MPDATESGRGGARVVRGGSFCRRRVAWTRYLRAAPPSVPPPDSASMRQLTLLLLAASGCAAPHRAPLQEAGLPTTILAAMQRLADAECPSPPEWPTLDGIWWRGSFGTVVAFDGRMVALRMDNPEDWPDDTKHLLVGIWSPRHRPGQPECRGDVILLGQCEGVLIGRFFPSTLGMPIPPALGDSAWVDHSTSARMRGTWPYGPEGWQLPTVPSAPGSADQNGQAVPAAQPSGPTVR